MMVRAVWGCVALLVAGSAIAADTATLWRNLSWFEGEWRGTEEALRGSGTASRCFAPILDGRYMFSRNHARFASQPRNPDGERRGEWHVYSRDFDRGVIVLRRFGSGGQIATFELVPEASRSDRYVFASVAFDNAPAEMHGRVTLTIGRSDTFTERLELGPDPDSLVKVSEGRWRRQSHDPGPCAGVEPGPN